MRPWREVWPAVLVLTLNSCVPSGAPPGSARGPTTLTSAPFAATTLPTLDPATQDMTVTTAPFDLPPEVLEATDGMLLGATREFVFDDGALGGGSIVLRVEDREARILRGRWCGTDWGPAPFDDLMGGAVVAAYEPGFEVVRCVPGRDVETLHGAGSPALTALIDGRPVLATLTWIGPDLPSTVELMDLDTKEVATLFEPDPSVEIPLAASRSNGGIWALTFARDASLPVSSVKYVFVDDQGVPVDVSGNPQSEYPVEDSGLGAAAITPDGNRLLTLQRREDNETDLIVWDLETGSEMARHGMLEALPDDPDTPWPEGRFGSSLFTSGTRAVVNVTAIAEEFHPHGIVVVDLSSGAVTEISGRYGNVWIDLASFIQP